MSTRRLPLLALACALGGCAAQSSPPTRTSWAAALVDGLLGVPVLTVAEDAARHAASGDEERVAELDAAFADFVDSRKAPDTAGTGRPIVIDRN